MSWTRYLSNPLASHWTYFQARGLFEKGMWPKIKNDLPRGSKTAAWIEYLKMLQSKGYITTEESRAWVRRK